MKPFLLIAVLFIGSHANSQVKDSTDNTAVMINTLNQMFGKVDGKNFLLSQERI